MLRRPAPLTATTPSGTTSMFPVSPGGMGARAMPRGLCKARTFTAAAEVRVKGAMQGTCKWPSGGVELNERVDDSIP